VSVLYLHYFGEQCLLSHVLHAAKCGRWNYVKVTIYTRRASMLIMNERLVHSDTSTPHKYICSTKAFPVVSRDCYPLVITSHESVAVKIICSCVYAPRHENDRECRGKASRNLYFGARYKTAVGFAPQEWSPGTDWIGGWVNLTVWQ